MLYPTYVMKAVELTVQQLDNGTWYLEPEWKQILRQNDLDLSQLKDDMIDGWFELQDILVLEVERRNARDSKKNEVIEWVHKLITETAEPAMLQEETDYIKNVIEFMKLNHEE